VDDGGQYAQWGERAGLGSDRRQAMGHGWRESLHRAKHSAYLWEQGVKSMAQAGVHTGYDELSAGV